jgi:hypothetical protein
MCGGQLSLVPYSFLEGKGGYKMILDWMWLGEFSYGRNVYMTLEKESMEVECTLIIAMENGWWIFMALCVMFLFV